VRHARDATRGEGQRRLLKGGSPNALLTSKAAVRLVRNMGARCLFSVRLLGDSGGSYSPPRAAANGGSQPDSGVLRLLRRVELLDLVENVFGVGVNL
jgi:hypothetical protein